MSNNRSIYPSQAPFDDVCVLISPRGAPEGEIHHEKSAILEGIRRALGGMSCRCDMPITGGPQITAFSAQQYFFKHDLGVVLFEGIAIHKEEVFSGGQNSAAQLQKLGEAPTIEPLLRGHFTYLCADSAKFTLATDWLGLSHLYRVTIDQHELVSNRLHILAEVLRFLKKLRFDHHRVALHFVMDTSFSLETPIEGVRLMPANHYLEVNAQGIHERGRYDWASEANAIGSQNYDDLIHQAAQEIKENCRAIATIAPEHPIVLYLTGGVDSRIVLAGTQAANISPLFYYTFGKKEDDDRRIADLLAAETGLQRLEDAETIDCSVSDATERWISMCYHQRSASMAPIYRRSAGRIRVIGAAGECFRGYYSRKLEKKVGVYREGTAPRKLANAFCSVVGNWDSVRRGVRARYRDEIEATIRNESLLSDSSAGIDGLYLLFRNRFHFGLGLRMESRDALKVAPLYSVSAVRASLLCDREGYSKGRAAHDILSVLAPKLLETEFYGGDFNKKAPGGLPAFQPKPFSQAQGIVRAMGSSPPHLSRGRSTYRQELWTKVDEVNQHWKQQDDSYFGSLRRKVLFKRIAEAQEKQDAGRARSLIMRDRFLRESHDV